MWQTDRQTQDIAMVVASSACVVCVGLSRHVLRSSIECVQLVRRGMARHHLVNNLNVTSTTQAHVVLLLTFTQVAPAHSTLAPVIVGGTFF